MNELKPYYQDSLVTLYHGDCLEVIPKLDLRFDMVITDPPYGINYKTSWRVKHDSLVEPIENDADLSILKKAWPLIDSALKGDGHWYCFASPQKLTEAIAITAPKQILCWDKGDRGTVGDLSCGFGEAWEAILYGIMPGRKPLNGSRPRSVIRYDWSATMDPVHPTVKPVFLLTKLIGVSSKPDDLILDPFAGSGTAGMAAKDLNRRAVLIETSERYCEIAANRCSQETMKLV